MLLRENLRWAPLSIFCVACAGRIQSDAFSAGNAQAEPDIAVLPSLDVPRRELTPEFRSAEDLSVASLGYALPANAREGAVDASWTDARLRSWLGEKQRRAEAARAALELAAVQNERQRIVVGALVGLVFEETAKSLLQVPAPKDLPLSPETIVVFREIMQKNASVCVEQARIGYAACVESAPALASMNHWGAFCEGRGKNLPVVHDPLAEELGGEPGAGAGM